MAGWVGRTVLAGAAAAGMAACQDANRGPKAGLIASAAGVPIAVDIVDGATPKIRTALASELSSAAIARRVEVVGSGGPARYRLRGYLTAETTADGAALAFVWDVFDDKSRLAKRLSGSSPIEKTASPDPWSGLDKAELARLAERSMDEIAGFLSANAAPDAPAEATGAEPG